MNAYFKFLDDFDADDMEDDDSDAETIGGDDENDVIADSEKPATGASSSSASTPAAPAVDGPDLTSSPFEST